MGLQSIKQIAGLYIKRYQNEDIITRKNISYS